MLLLLVGCIAGVAGVVRADPPGQYQLCRSVCPNDVGGSPLINEYLLTISLTSYPSYPSLSGTHVD